MLLDRIVHVHQGLSDGVAFETRNMTIYSVVLVMATLTCLTPSVGGPSVGGPADRDPDLPLAESVVRQKTRRYAQQDGETRRVARSPEQPSYPLQSIYCRVKPIL